MKRSEFDYGVVKCSGVECRVVVALVVVDSVVWSVHIEIGKPQN